MEFFLQHECTLIYQIWPFFNQAKSNSNTKQNSSREAPTKLFCLVFTDNMVLVVVVVDVIVAVSVVQVVVVVIVDNVVMGIDVSA